MKITIENGTITFDCLEFVQEMDNETRAEVARFVAADEKLFEAVCDFVAGGSFFDDDRSPWWFDSTVRAKLTERLMPLMPDATRALVRELIRQRDQAALLEKQLRDDYWKLWHAFPREEWRLRPEPSRDYPHAPAPSDADAEAIIAGGPERA